MSKTTAEYLAWFRDRRKIRRTIFEITFAGNNSGALGEFVTRMANGPYKTKSTDTPANTIFHEGVLQSPDFTEAMSESLSGRSTQSAGDLIWSNANGERDSWFSMNWDGRRIRQWVGDASWAFADMLLVLDGTIVDVFDAGNARGGFHITGKEGLLNRPVMTDLLGGTGPEAGDLDPLVYGEYCFNIKPKLIDEVNHIYRVTKVNTSGVIELLYPGDNSQENPPDVREAGISLQTSITLTSSDLALDLLHSVGHGLAVDWRIRFLGVGGTPPAPLANNTDYWVIAAGLTADDFQVAATWGGAAINLTGAQTGTPTIYCYGWTKLANTADIQLAGNPAGIITCDANGLSVGSGVGTPSVYPGQVVNQLLTSDMTNTPLSSADIDAASLAAFNVLCSTSISPPRYGRFVGAYVTQKISFADLIDALVMSANGWWGFSRAGLLQFGILDIPTAGTPVVSFTIDDVMLRSFKMHRRILPRAQIKLIGSTNWTVQDTVSGNVTEYNRAAYAAPNAVATGNATVTTWDTDPANHINAVHPDPYQTLLATTPGLQDEANRLATMFQYPTAILGFECRQIAYMVSRGDLIYMTHPRYTGYGIITSVRRQIKGASEIRFFCQLPDVYPTGDIG